MCRFLLCKSDQPISPFSIIEKFTIMAQNCKAYDGDWQGDGWGITWLDNKNRWKIYKSLLPIWKDFQQVKLLTLTKIFAVHARSSSFEKHEDNINYNQPYIAEPYIFVFNGLLKGVTLSSDVPGNIGAQKIWFLLNKYLQKYTPELSLEKINKLLKNNTKDLQALNIGIANKNNIFSLCNYSKYPNYYQLRYTDSSKIKIITSEKIGDYTFNSATVNQIISL